MIVVGALFFDPTGISVYVLLGVLAVIGWLEMAKLVKCKPILGLLCLPFIGYLLLGHSTGSLIVLIGFSFASVIAKLRGEKQGFGPIFIGTTFAALTILSTTKLPSGWPLVLVAAIPIWCGDTAAIFVGKAFGKHKLAPKISPNKTWEGSIGNLVACLVASFTLGHFLKIPMLASLLLGLNTGILGQAGDLFESYLKREAGVKDSGTLLPGHGGVLDRLDSLLFTAPISLLILYLLVIPGKP